MCLQNWLHSFELAYHGYLANMTIHSSAVQDKPVLLMTAEQMAVATNTAESGEY